MGKSLRLQRDEISLTRNEKWRHFAPAGGSTQVIAGNFIIPVSQLGPGGLPSLRCDAASCETSSHWEGPDPGTESPGVALRQPSRPEGCGHWGRAVFSTAS